MVLSGGQSLVAEHFRRLRACRRCFSSRTGHIAANASLQSCNGTVCHAQRGVKRIGQRPAARLAGQRGLPTFAGQEQIPRLARQRLDYLVKSLTEYRDGSRSGIDTSMNGVMYRVPDRDIRALAHYLGSLR